jgi:diguanylate cyclase (GGDEF)-like protein
MLSVTINSIVSACLVIVLIFADYFCLYNTEPFRRRLYLSILIVVFTAIIANTLGIIFAELPGERAALLHGLTTVYFILQTAAFYLLMVFLDYITYKNRQRTGRLFIAAAAVLLVQSTLLILNLSYHFYFYYSADNQLIRRIPDILRFLIGYAAFVIMVADIIKSKSLLKQSQIFFIIFFILIIIAGEILGFIFRSFYFFWPLFTAALLYLYFFLIQSDLKIDGLTGLGNRYGFSEFFDQLAGSNGRQSYWIVMIDMDGLKKINDTWGHLEGDNALRDFAAITKGTLRHSDFAFRYGGDEFILAIKAEYDIEKLIVRIQETIAMHNDKKVRPYTLKISYGYDMFTPGSGQQTEPFMKRIDGLMYEQKAAGRQATRS